MTSDCAPTVHRAVEVHDVVKRFPTPDGGAVTAVDSVSFEVTRGEVFGLLGPNGAGKTTTLEIIEGLAEPTSGTTRLLGLDSRQQREELKQRIGVQLQESSYFSFLTLEELLDLFGSFYERPVESHALLDRVELLDKRKAQVHQLSGGQKQRFSIAAAIVNDPEIIFLDEPTTGLDPQARRNLWDFIRAVNQDDGKTVVLTTHYMEEAETLCDRVAIMDRGTIEAIGTPAELVAGLPTAYHIQFESPEYLAEPELSGLPCVTHARVVMNGRYAYELQVSDAAPVLAELMRRVTHEGLQRLRVIPATLEDAFLSITGHTLRD